VTRAFRIDPADAVPLWKQIEDGVRRLVAGNDLPPGSAVDSVREMAKALRVNPATVARAYGRLIEAGVLTVRRGEGTYVADAPPTMRAAERTRELDAAAARFAAAAGSLGASREDAVDSLERMWSRMRLGTGTGGKQR
jgi:GntR family transcriptional regulator